MKKISFAVVALFFSFVTSNAQNRRCAELQAGIENAEKQIAKLDGKKFPLEEFFSLVENAKPDMNSLGEELTITVEQTRSLQKKRSAGDNSPETAADLQSLLARTELIKLRMSKNYNQNTFLKHPKYRELERALGKLKADEQNLKVEIATKGQEMSTNNCPRTDKKPSDDDLEITVDLDDKTEVIVKDDSRKNKTQPCNEIDAAAFAKLIGSWKSYRMHVTISGSCEQVTGTWKVTEWCEGVDETYNATVARINGTFTGKMQGGYLQVNYKSPPSPNNKEGTKGPGSISLQANDTLSCSFGCSGGVLEKNK